MFNNVKSRIYLLAGLPLFVALFFMLGSISEKYSTMHEMDTLEPTTQLSIHIGAFVHEIQKERGATAGLLGGNKNFQSILTKQREETNIKRSTLNDYLTTFEVSNYESKFSNTLDATIAEMDRIDTIRSRVDSRSIKTKDAISFYTHHNSLMLGLVGLTVDMAKNSDISQLRSAYSTFMQGKERAGIERAIMSNVFNIDEFRNGAYNKFSMLVTAQDTYTHVFKSFANSEQIKFFEQQMSNPAIAEVQRMRDIAKSTINNMEKARLLLELNEAIGYGGIIHQFKNFVIRGTPKYRDNTKQKFNLATELLDKYEHYQYTSEKEKVHIRAIRGVINNYHNALEIVQEMHAAGALVSEIDAAVKISDKPALEALHHLEQGTVLGNFGIDSKHWFDTITTKINLLKSVEDHLAENLGKRGNELREEANNELITLSLLALTMTLGIIITTFIVGKSITDPLQHSVAFAQQIAAGDLTGQISIKRNDEVGKLQQAMNDMRHKLVDMFSGIGDAASQLSASSEELATITAQTTQSILQQQSETEQVATAINEMAATITEVAASAEHASVGAQEANTAAQSGQLIVNNTITAVDEIATKVEHNANVVRKVHEDSDKISVVLDVIRGIAEQTNLLALNAAIEAARAGEQGRGFAVVADEVRTLASRTQESTQEIQKVIEELQTSAKEAAAAMDTGATEAHLGAEKASKAKEALEAITTTVGSITDMNSQIASAAEEQSAVAADIDRSICNISQVSGETSNSAEQLSKASNNLAQLSSGLTTMISEFKV